MESTSGGAGFDSLQRNLPCPIWAGETSPRRKKGQDDRSKFQLQKWPQSEGDRVSVEKRPQRSPLRHNEGFPFIAVLPDL